VTHEPAEQGRPIDLDAIYAKIEAMPEGERARVIAEVSVIDMRMRPPSEIPGWLDERSEDDLRYLVRGWCQEAANAEEVLCDGLRIPKSDGGPDDPNGGGYLTGDDTVVSLAMRARNRLRRVEQLLAEVLGFEPDDNGHYDVKEYDAETLAIEASQRLWRYREKDPKIAEFSDLMLRSSLGTPEALRIRAQTPRHLAEEILKRVKKTMEGWRDLQFDSDEEFDAWLAQQHAQHVDTVREGLDVEAELADVKRRAAEADDD
jgi:hypothetical protein